jgi:hypothetical protein
MVMTAFEFLGNVAAIATSIVAVLAYGLFLHDRRRKRLRLESYLKEERGHGYDQGQQTLVHLVANVGMSETKIMDAAFRSKKIRRTVDNQGKADKLLLEYDGEDDEGRITRPKRARY